ncbi:MAG: hypothetical protein VW879_07970, partial [Opitutae bacterium]
MSDCITLSNAVILLWRLSFAVVFLSASGWSYGIDETLEGWQVEYFSDGQRRSEGEYQHGQRTGFWFYYHQNGEKVADGAFARDVRNGKWRFWDPDGRILSTQNFYLGKLHGVKKTYHPDGREESVQTFELGNATTPAIHQDILGIAKNGAWVEKSREGDVLAMGHYDHGLRIGEWLFYHSNRNVRAKVTYKSGYK